MEAYDAEYQKQYNKAVVDIIWKQSCLYWAKKNIINEKGNILEFTDRAFLKDIYDDWTPVQTIRKASQVGFSTMEILKSFYAAKYRGYNIIYTLPTFADVGQFVPSKVNSLIRNTPILQEWTYDKDTILQKKVGNGFIYFRGTFTSGKEKMESGVGIMFSSDLNIHDECDRSDQMILEQYESRLEASGYGGKWYFSNPTSPHTLSQQVWEKSDQKHWFVKCSHCKKWQYLDYWKNVTNDKFICQYCNREITDNDRREGQWVKKYSNRDISGYWISHLICPWISAKKISEQENLKGKQYFYNFVLGLPYRGSDIIVDKDLLLKCVDLTKPNFQEHNAMGIDTGLEKHYVILNREGIFKLGKTKDWEEIERLIKIYDVETCVIDALPDLTEPRKIRDRYPGKIWLNYFRKEIRKADYIIWDSKTRTVFSDRTKIIQNTIDKFVNRETRFQMRPEELSDYVKHWEALYKTVEKDPLGIERDVWQSSGEDHYVFATVYGIIALERSEKGGTEIKSWREREQTYSDLAPDIQKMIKEQEQFL